MVRRSHWLCFIVLGRLVATGWPCPAAALESLAIFSQGFPRTLFFRNAEALAVEGLPAAEFDAIVNRYNGIVVKAFDEEKYGLSKYALEYFRAYKERNPRQLVLLHFNGAARDPRSAPGFFAGHWLHYGGCRITSDLDAGARVVEVESAGLFRMDVGKRYKMPDDLTLCALKADGTPDWRVCEQARLVSIDAAAKRLTIERGALGTKPLAWKAGQAYVAAHMGGGSFPMEGDEPRAMWSYNFSLDAPKDAQGRGLFDALAEELAAKLGPDGPGAYFDGLEFDVMPWQPPQRLKKHMENAGRGQDTDGDGQPDFGFRDGVNRFGAGVEAFLHRLRERLGKDRLILRDMNRRADGVLNGVESEGWPSPFDLETNDWSSGMNEHRFWAERGAEPRLTYLHYKYAERREGEDNKPVKFPFSRSRLILAAAHLLGDAMCTNNGPAPEADEKYGLFDELKMGTERRANWLGLPKGEARRLALETGDLFLGEGAALSKPFQERLSSRDAKVEIVEGRPPVLRISANDAEAESFSVLLSKVRVPNSDLVLWFRVKADPMRELPPDVCRRVTVRLADPPDAATTPRELWTWANGEWFDATFYFRGLKSGSVDLELVAEDSGAVCISEVKAFGAPDVVVREFENGLVLANPGLAPHTFDLAALYPHKAFRRLRGSPSQDPEANNGQGVGATVTLGPRDGLFLVREGKPTP